MNRLRAFLAKHSLIAIDTCVFIYHMEAHPEYRRLTRELFAWLERGEGLAVTSAITLTGLLVQPYRAHEHHLAKKYTALLTAFPHLAWIPLDARVADAAAVIRAEYKFKTPDALQLATAVTAGASGFITSDAALGRVYGLDVAVLSECR